MDPISTAIIAAIASGVTTSAFNSLKALITSKFGKGNKISKAIANVEDEPKSKGLQILLTERIEEMGANKDKEILEAAKELLTQLKKTTDGEKHIMNAKGVGIAQADRGSTATVAIK